MAPSDDPRPPDPAPAWSAGPCPECGDAGALLVLRRREDAALLLHCPSCGLTTLHGAGAGAAGEPGGDSLSALAPGGATAVTGEEARAAGIPVLPLSPGAFREMLEGSCVEPGRLPPPPRTRFPEAAVEHPSPLLVGMSLWILFTLVAGGALALAYLLGLAS